MKIKFYLLFFSACISMHAFAVIHTITVGCCLYTPSTLTANCGDTIRFQWVNFSHPTVSETAAWTTFPMDAANPTKDIVLTTAGTYPYYCDIHGDPGGIGMSGTITITCTPPPCTTPATITAGMITSSSAKIVWSAVESNRH
ncbi:MAG: hypothetical protein H7X71_02840 [Chitinophagales bacterium]|nr:hypothetical protein [Chitinophagales bacterium]